MMNNKGFTLIEVLCILTIIALVFTIAIKTAGSTLSARKEDTYKLMKNNIVSAGYDYINECKAKTIQCDFSFEDKNTFPVAVLKEMGYFSNLESPIDGKDLSSCLLLEATNSNGVTVIDLIDNCYNENFIIDSCVKSVVLKWKLVIKLVQYYYSI